MTMMTSVPPASNSLFFRKAPSGFFIGLVAGAVAMWLLTTVAPDSSGPTLGASGLPDWHGNVMRSHQSE